MAIVTMTFTDSEGGGVVVESVCDPPLTKAEDTTPAIVMAFEVKRFLNMQEAVHEFLENAAAVSRMPRSGGNA